MQDNTEKTLKAYLFIDFFQAGIVVSHYCSMDHLIDVTACPRSHQLTAVTVMCLVHLLLMLVNELALVILAQTLNCLVHCM